MLALPVDREVLEQSPDQVRMACSHELVDRLETHQLRDAAPSSLSQAQQSDEARREQVVRVVGVKVLVPPLYEI